MIFVVCNCGAKAEGDAALRQWAEHRCPPIPTRPKPSGYWLPRPR